MSRARAKAALEQSTPYLSLGTLLGLATLFVMMLQAGILDLTAGSDPASRGEVSELSRVVSGNSHSIGELRRADERQDAALKAVQSRTDDRIKGIEQTLQDIYQILVRRAEREDGGRSSRWRHRGPG